VTNRVKTPRTAGLIVLGCLLASCGAPSTRAAAPGQRLAVQEAQTVDVQAAEAEAPDPMEARIAALNLSAEQLQQIQALFQKMQPAANGDTAQERVEKLKAMLAAKDVTVPDLVAHINESRQLIRDRRQALEEAVIGIRDILTPEQRTQIAQMPPPEETHSPLEIAEDLKLNDEQIKALAPLHPADADKVMREAIRQFMQSGDKAALGQAIDASVDKLPSAEAVATAMASLTHEQRQKLIELAEGRAEEAEAKVEKAKEQIKDAKEAAALPPKAQAAEPADLPAAEQAPASN
jgi:hypothetical protein